MANALYPSFKKLLLDGDIDLLVDNIKASIVDLGTYTFNSAHDFRDDLSGVVATSGNLSTKTTTGGAFDSADPVISAVSGATVEAIVLWKDTGNNATSPLIAFIDTGVTGLPLTPDGSDVQIVVDAAGWFAL